MKLARCRLKQRDCDLVGRPLCEWCVWQLWPEDDFPVPRATLLAGLSFAAENRDILSQRMVFARSSTWSPSPSPSYSQLRLSAKCHMYSEICNDRHAGSLEIHLTNRARMETANRTVIGRTTMCSVSLVARSDGVWAFVDRMVLIWPHQLAG